MLETKSWMVTIELLEDCLGTVPKKKNVYAGYIAGKVREHADKEAKRAAKNPDGVPRMASGEEAADVRVAEMMAEEIETVQEVEEKGWSGFHEDDRGPFLYDYLVKGFLCEAARTLKEIGTLKQLQDKFKRYVFVRPRRIYLNVPCDQDGKPVFEANERPLRAMTPLGPRVTVVRSDVVKAGTRLTFKLVIIRGGGVTRNIVSEVLEYGEFIGLGQWRSGGWGRFTVVEMAAD